MYTEKSKLKDDKSPWNQTEDEQDQNRLIRDFSLDINQYIQNST